MVYIASRLTHVRLCPNLMTIYGLHLLKGMGGKHGTIIRRGITCKKIPCYMRDSVCKWFVVKKVKIF